MKELIKRWQSDTPTFWKKVRNTAVSVGVIGGVILTLPVSLPAATVGFITNVVIVCAAIAPTAQCTIKPTEDDKEF